MLSGVILYALSSASGLMRLPKGDSDPPLPLILVVKLVLSYGSASAPQTFPHTRFAAASTLLCTQVSASCLCFAGAPVENSCAPLSLHHACCLNVCISHAAGIFRNPVFLPNTATTGQQQSVPMHFVSEFFLPGKCIRLHFHHT